MSEQPSLWDRIRRARVFQVLAVYLGASWVVLQIADVLVDALTLPPWVVPVTLILLLVGMVVILATAWIQSLPSTTAREAAGELPTDWQIAPRDVLASLRQGRMPHLTWGRSIAGGVVVVALLFGGAGMYVGMSRGEGLRIGPAQASASEAAEGIAVVPFEVRGQDLEIWREGMMDLLSNGLDGVGGFRTIDSRTVMARWNDQVGDAATADLATTLSVARAVDARFALEGSVVGLGPNVRLVANVYDLDTDREVATAQSEGPAEDVLRLVDELAVRTMRALLLSIGRAGAGDLSAETITTSSLPALRSFLEGENHYRKGRFADAVQSYERAVAADSTFAIALVRLSESYGWLESQNSARMLEVGERAIAQAHRLSPRYQFIMEGWDALNRGSAEGLPSLEEAVRKYPDDPEAWFLLAETYIHVGGATYGTDEQLWEALRRATTLDPSFAPYLVHLAEFAVLRGDRALADSTLARYETLAGNRNDLEHISLAIPLLLGSDEEAAAVLENADSIAPRTFDLYGGTFARRHDRFDRDAAADAVWAKLTEANRVAFQAYYAGSMGRIEHGGAVAREPRVTPSDRGIYWGHVNELWNTDPSQHGAAAAMSPAVCDDPAFNSTCHLFVGTAAARLGRWPDHRRTLERLREQAAAVVADNPASAGRIEALADVVEGAGAAHQGDTRRGRELLERHAQNAGLAGERARLELAWLEAAAGRPERALRHFRSALAGYSRPLALYGVASMHEQLGQPEQARPYWASLVTLTRAGDELPRILEARQALARSAGEPAVR
ncbi:MAG TPA: tetratricopeptide repeat protein [Longimicrobiales bacterium]|nr:tetratricopeptide repeat protein [Longimicrobiales bacterium]